MHEDPDHTPTHDDKPAEAARRLGDAIVDATYADGADGAPPPAVTGLVTGEVGPKSRVGASLRRLDRDARRRGELAPRGSSVPGMGWLLVGTIALLVIAAALVVVLLGWLTS
jgi:hypothetical protein